MRMLSMFAAIAATSLAAPAVAESGKSASFEHEGVTYVYTVEQKGDAQVISGKRYPGAIRFRLRVRDGHVSGISNGVAVRFRESQALGASSANPTTLSMR